MTPSVSMASVVLLVWPLGASCLVNVSNMKSEIVNKPLAPPQGGCGDAAAVQNAQCARRETWVDSLKGFVIILVVFGHVVQRLRVAAVAGGSENAGLLQAVEASIYAFHMPLFFLISGFVFAMAYFDKSGRLRREKVWWQVANLFLLYLIFAALFAVYLFFSQPQFVYNLGGYTSFGQFLLSVLYLPLGEYWYLYDLCIAYVLFVVGVRFVSSEVLLVLSCILAVVVAPFSDIFVVKAPGYAFFDIPRLVTIQLPFFFLGVVIFSARLKLSLWVSLCTLVVAVTLFVLSHYSPLSSVRAFTWGANRAAALGLSLFFFDLFRRVRLLDCNVLRVCGEFSLVIYLFHFAALKVANVVVAHMGIQALVPVVIVKTIVATALPLLLAVVLQRVGLYRHLFRPANTVGALVGRLRSKA